LNVNGLNSSIKKYLLANWTKKGNPTICCLQETHLIDRNKHWFMVKGWKIFQANSLQKQAGLAILISDDVDFKLTLIKKDKGHFILIKGAIHQEEITIINLCAPNVSAPNFIKYILKHIDPNRVVVGNFNTLLSHIANIILSGEN
jgi:exonuclease III